MYCISTDPVVKIFPPVVVIEQLGQVMVTCISTSPELPVHWTIGNRQIQEGGPFTLSPPGLHHSLQVMLDASDQSLLQEPFSCSVEDPELNTTVASGVAPVYVVPGKIHMQYECSLYMDYCFVCRLLRLIACILMLGDVSD